MASSSPQVIESRSGIVGLLDHSSPSAVDWGAIIAGGLLATAISFILITFGAAIGLSLTSPYEGSGASLVVLAVAAGLWVVWVQISSFMAGAYLAGRLRRRPDATAHEAEVRDGCHGLLVWTVGVLIGATLAAWVASSVASSGAAVLSSATRAMGTAAAQTVVSSGNPLEYAVDTLFRSDNPQGAEGIAASGQEAARILATSAAQGSISADDKAYLARLVQASNGIGPNRGGAADRSDLRHHPERRREGEGRRRQGAPYECGGSLHHRCRTGGERCGRLVGRRCGRPSSGRRHRFQSSRALAVSRRLCRPLWAHDGLDWSASTGATRGRESGSAEPTCEACRRHSACMPVTPYRRGTGTCDCADRSRLLKFCPGEEYPP
jgi:hypothetical protein